MNIFTLRPDTFTLNFNLIFQVRAAGAHSTRCLLHAPLFFLAVVIFIVVVVVVVLLLLLTLDRASTKQCFV